MTNHDLASLIGIPLAELLATLFKTLLEPERTLSTDEIRAEIARVESHVRLDEMIERRALERMRVKLANGDDKKAEDQG